MRGASIDLFTLLRPATACLPAPSWSGEAAARRRRGLDARIDFAARTRSERRLVTRADGLDRTGADTDRTCPAHARRLVAERAAWAPSDPQSTIPGPQDAQRSRTLGEIFHAAARWLQRVAAAVWAGIGARRASPPTRGTITLRRAPREED